MATQPNEDRYHLATVGFHRAIARAHDEYADAIAMLTETVEAPETPQLRGSLQRRIVGLPEMLSDRGMTSKEVATATTGDYMASLTIGGQTYKQTFRVENTAPSTSAPTGSPFDDRR